TGSASRNSVPGATGCKRHFVCRPRELWTQNGPPPKRKGGPGQQELSGGDGFLRCRCHRIRFVAVDRTEYGQERGRHDVTVDAHAESGGRIAHAHLDIAGCTCVGTGSDGVLMVVHDLHVALQGVDKGGNGPVPTAGEHTHFAVVFQFDLDFELLAGTGVGVTRDAVANQLPGSVLIEIFAAEDVVDFASGNFAAGLVRHALDGAAEFDLQTPRQDQAVFLLEQVGHPALAGLAVDADDGVVAAAD